MAVVFLIATHASVFTKQQAEHICSLKCHCLLAPCLRDISLPAASAKSFITVTWGHVDECPVAWTFWASSSLHLHTKFQLRAFCSSLGVAWRKSQIISHTLFDAPRTTLEEYPQNVVFTCISNKFNLL